jgi:hypothetical protein
MTLPSVWSLDWLKVRLPAWMPTLSVMLEPACRVSVLAPPVKVMALAWDPPSPDEPPVILPSLVMARFAPTMPAPPAPAAPGAEPPAPPAPPSPPWMPFVASLLVMIRFEPLMPAPPAPPLPP